MTRAMGAVASILLLAACSDPARRDTPPPARARSLRLERVCPDYSEILRDRVDGSRWLYRDTVVAVEVHRLGTDITLAKACD